MSILSAFQEDTQITSFMKNKQKKLMLDDDLLLALPLHPTVLMLTYCGLAMPYADVDLGQLYHYLNHVGWSESESSVNSFDYSR